jgi:aldose sugar dehydrogenase
MRRGWRVVRDGCGLAPRQQVLPSVRKTKGIHAYVKKVLKISLSASLALCASFATAQNVRADVVASGLENPWALAFLPQNRFLVTERPGRMRIIGPDGRMSEPLRGVPEVAAGGQGGLLDVVLDSGFERNRTLYFCFSEPGGSGRGNSTALARATLSADSQALEAVQVIFSQKPKFSSSAHFGCRIVEGRQGERTDGTLFLTLGDRFSRMQDAQKLDNHHGKVVRINKDGSVPADNPFVKRQGALPEIWSWGHRNSQGAAAAPDGTFWMHEHGPQGGDEINIPVAGRNYGWPIITYGESYGGGAVGEGLTQQPGLEQPLHYWTPSIAPSGMAFLTSERYGPKWRGNLFIGSLKFGYLNRIELSEPFKGKVVREHKLLQGEGRIRDVRQGPDGLLYVVTDSSRGRLLRVLPG